jgi:hypothetical protein
MANASPSCSFSTSWSMGCKSVAGIIEVYAGAFSATTTSFSYTPTGIITGGTLAPDFYTLEQGLEYADVLFEGGHSVENGTNFWNHTANLKFNPYDGTNRNLLTALANPRLMLIAYTQSGKYVLLGETNGLDVTASSGGFAKELGGLNGSLVTLSGKEPSAPRELTSAYFATLTVN